MAKPGIKVIEENKYKVNVTGVLKYVDGKIMFDISEESDGSDIIDVKEYFERMNNELVSFSLTKREVVEEE